MDFQTAAQISALLSKDYAEDFFRLLVNYQDISASEAASRLRLHIRTAQDFLEGLTELGIVNKTEVHEKKRPYFRYTLAQSRLTIELDLSQFAKADPGEGLARRVREIKNPDVNFSIARSGDRFSAITIWEGDGREREVHEINLTSPQGKFLFHLPFPTSRPLSIADVMEQAEIEPTYAAEIQDIVDELGQRGVIEIHSE